MNRVGTDIVADPFAEKARSIGTRRLQLLGADFHFECHAPALGELVKAAYGGLPVQRLHADPPRIRVKLVLLPGAAPGRQAQPAAGAMIAGPGYLCAANDASSFAIVSPAERAGLVTLSAAMLRHPYHARYEYLEFAVFMLAARVQGLVPLHAACIGRGRDGVLLMGPSGSGKSTAALHCLLRGMDFLAEDAVFVAPEKLVATGVANYLHVCRNSLQWLRRSSVCTQIRSSPLIRRRSGVRKFEVDLRRGSFSLAATPLHLKAVVFLSARKAGRQSLLRPLPTSQIRSALTLNQPYAAGRPEWDSFIRKVESLPVFTLLRGSHPNDTVDAIEALLKSNGSARAGHGRG
ncbi:MAG: hypothetical protein WA825_12745 [Steroidobacteraceae bacterium]